MLTVTASASIFCGLSCLIYSTHVESQHIKSEQKISRKNREERKITWKGNEINLDKPKISRNIMTSCQHTNQFFIGDQIMNPIQEANYNLIIKALKDNIKLFKKCGKENTSKKYEFLLQIAQNTENHLKDSREGNTVLLSYNNNISREEFYKVVLKLEKNLNEKGWIGTPLQGYDTVLPTNKAKQNLYTNSSYISNSIKKTSEKKADDSKKTSIFRKEKSIISQLARW